MRELGIREVQEISLEILKEITDICDQENIRYCLMYGTLLGAIRHQGYIPWDDDVDIMMPRKDHDRFLRYMKEHEAESVHLKVFDPKTCPEYPYMITRVSDDRYVIDMDNEEGYGMGVFVDIYPFDGLGDTKREALAFGKIGDLLSSFCYQATRKRFAVETTTSKLRLILKFPVFITAKLFGKNHYQKKLMELENVHPYDLSVYVGCVVWLTGGERDVFLKKWFDEFEKKPYEQYMFNVPKAYDQILRHIYGDYMELPPEKDRIGHHNYVVHVNE